MNKTKTITYTVGCNEKLIIGKLGEVDYRTVFFNNVKRVNEDSTIYFNIQVRGADPIVIGLAPDMSFTVPHEMLEISGTFRGQLEEVSADGTQYGVVSTFDVNIRGANPHRDVTELTSEEVNRWANTINNLYNQIKTDYDNGEFTPKVDISKQGNTTTISIIDGQGLHQSQITDGINGRDGEKGERGDKGDKGDKGDPGEVTYIENPYDDTVIKQDINSLKNKDASTDAEISLIKKDLLDKVDKVEGKGLSTNDYTNAEKSKLSTLKNYDDSAIREKIQDIELAKFPNVTIFGQPTINQGQISNFNATNYCQFPFIVNFQNQPFTLDFEITTGSEVNNQHNVFDSVFGLAFAVRQSRFVVAISTNGTNWNIGEGIGTHVIQANSTYRVRMNWDKTNFTVAYSTDGGTTYITDITKPLTVQPYPKQMYIGITSDKSTFFNGIINLNYSTLTIANKIVWQGMDDVGLATRADVSLSNLDEIGESRFSDINENVSQLSESIADIQSDLSAVYLITNIDLENANNGFIDKSGNVITQYDGYRYTNPIDVKKGQTVVVNAQGYSTNVSIISEVVGSTNKPLIVSSDSTFKKYEYVAKQDMQIRLSYAYNHGENASVYYFVKKEIEALDETKVDVFNEKSLEYIKGWCEANGTPHINQGTYYECTKVTAINPNFTKKVKIENPYKGSTIAVITFFSAMSVNLSNVCKAVTNSDGKDIIEVDVPSNAICYVVSKSPSNATKVSEYLDMKTVLGLINDSKYRGCNINIVGDSYSTYENYILQGNWWWYGNPNTGTNDVASVKDTWFYKLAKSLNAKVLANDSSSGTTVSTSVRTEGQEWSAMVNRVTGSMGQTKCKSSDAKADLIIVLGGRNDYTLNVPVGENKYYDITEADKKQFAPAFCWLIDYLIKFNPYAEVVAVSGSHLGTDYNNAIALCCYHYGIKNIVLPDFELQSGHPSKNGMDVIASEIRRELLK